MISYEDWIYNYKRLPNHNGDAIQNENALQQQLLDELNARPNMRSFLAKYDEASAEEFLQDYTRQKVDMIKLGVYYFEQMEEATKPPFQKYADAAIIHLLYKKFYNLECLWRAGRIKIPMISVGEEWNFWLYSEYIFRCPFLPAITQEELNVLHNYFDDTSESLCYWDQPLYDTHYSNFHPAKKDSVPMPYPEWFRYYDEAMGTGWIHQLPDLKGDAERKYLALWRSHFLPDAVIDDAASTTFVQPAPLKPIFNTGSDGINELIARFDDPYLIALSGIDGRETNANKHWQESDSEVELHYNTICNLDPLPTMPGGMDWRESMRICCNQYLAGHINDLLELQYPDYLSQRAKIAMSVDDYEQLLLHSYAYKTRHKILEIRAVLGEPEDFDY